MTARKKVTGGPVWYSRSFTLSDKEKGELLAALGFNEASDENTAQWEACCKKIEYWLGFYPGAVVAIDNAPSAAVYVSEIQSVKDLAADLIAKIQGASGINEFTRETLSAHFDEAVSLTGPDGIAKTTIALGNLLAACESALRALRPEMKKETRGTKRKKSREMVLSELLNIYAEFSQVPRMKRKSSGAVARISEYELQQRRFVRIAFAAIAQDRFLDDLGDKKWSELIRNAQSFSVSQPAGKKE